MSDNKLGIASLALGVVSFIAPFLSAFLVLFVSWPKQFGANPEVPLGYVQLFSVQPAFVIAPIGAACGLISIILAIKLRSHLSKRIWVTSLILGVIGLTLSLAILALSLLIFRSMSNIMLMIDP
jgi:hypothetical protein